MFGDLFGNIEQQQEELAKQLESIEISADAGDGAVKVTSNGLRTITNISIDTSKLDMEDVEQIEDLLMVAVNRALDLASTREAEESQKLINDMLPPGMGGLFGRG